MLANVPCADDEARGHAFRRNSRWVIVHPQSGRLPPCRAAPTEKCATCLRPFRFSKRTSNRSSAKTGATHARLARLIEHMVAAQPRKRLTPEERKLGEQLWLGARDGKLQEVKGEQRVV